MILQTLPARSGWRLFKIEGQLDYASAPVVQAAIAHTGEFERGNLIVDLEDVKVADEKGVAALIAGIRRLMAGSRAIEVAIVAHQAWLADALSRGEFPRPVSVYRDGGQALGALVADQARAA